MNTLRNSLLLSAVYFMLPEGGVVGDGANGGGGGMTDRQRALADAVAQLDDANDDHWLGDGKPRMEAVEAIFGDTTPTREEVDKVGRVRKTPGTDSELPAPASTQPDPNPPPPASNTNSSQSPKITAGRIVIINCPKQEDGSGGIDGDESCVAIVTKVRDDGTINAHGFAPNGGTAPPFTGVHFAGDVESMPAGADRNAAAAITWDWPPRG